MINLRIYQDAAVSGIRDAFRRLVLAVLLVIPTGGGKTVIFTYIAHAMSTNKKKSLILVHRVELLRQTSAALSKFDVDHGMINPLYTPNFDNFVQVASVQTIIKRLNYFIAIGWIPDVIIVDEAHHATAGSWRTVIDFFKQLNPALKVIGVTATPIRTDGQGLGVDHGGMFNEIVMGPTTKWLMDEGYLVRAKVLSPPKKYESPKKNGRGDFRAADLEARVNKPTITGDVVSHYEKVCKGQPTIVFCVNVNHTEEVAAEFRARGYRFYAIDGTTDDDVRKRVINGLADGSVQGVVSCDLISEGTDVPAATCAILLRETQSLSLYIQQAGRVLRPVYAPGYDLNTREGRLAAIAASEKPIAYILDHVGNVGSWVEGEFIVNHGLPEEEHEWTLDGEKNGRKKKESEEIAVRVQQCLSCFAVHEPSPVCPECGHVYEIKDRTPKKAEGELQEITADIAAKRQSDKMEEGMANSYEDYVKIAQARGYNNGWAGIRWAAKKKQIQDRERKRAEREAAKAAKEIQFEEVAEVLELGVFDDDFNF